MISFTATLASLKLKVGQMIPIYARRRIKSNHYKPFSSLSHFSLPISD